MLLAFHGFLGIESGTWFGGARLGSDEWWSQRSYLLIYQAIDLQKSPSLIRIYGFICCLIYVLGGGNSKICYFHPEAWGRFPI